MLETDPERTELRRLANFLEGLHRARLLDGVHHIIDLEGFIGYRVKEADSTILCKCGFCVGGICRGVLETVRSLSDNPQDQIISGLKTAATVFRAGLLCGLLEPSKWPLFSFLEEQPVSIHDICARAFPSVNEGTQEECPVCYSIPVGENALYRSRHCTHTVCKECWLQWARVMHNLSIWEVTCPICRAPIQPPEFPLRFFSYNYESEETLRLTYTWFCFTETRNPNHSNYELENAWEKAAVETFCELLHSHSHKLPGVRPSWDGVLGPFSSGSLLLSRE